MCCIGRVKSEHAGRLAAFDSQLTIIHAEHVAVFTVNNGPLYIGRYIHLALHFLILDYIIASNNRTLRSAVISGGTGLSWLRGRVTGVAAVVYGTGCDPLVV